MCVCVCVCVCMMRCCRELLVVTNCPTVFQGREMCMYDVVLPGVTGRDELSVLCSRGGNSVCVMRCCRELLDAIGRRQPWDSRSLQQTDFRRSLSFLDLVGLGDYMTLYHYHPNPITELIITQCLTSALPVLPPSLLPTSSPLTPPPRHLQNHYHHHL